MTAEASSIGDRPHEPRRSDLVAAAMAALDVSVQPQGGITATAGGLNRQPTVHWWQRTPVLVDPRSTEEIQAENSAFQRRRDAVKPKPLPHSARGDTDDVRSQKKGQREMTPRGAELAHEYLTTFAGELKKHVPELYMRVQDAFASPKQFLESHKSTLESLDALLAEIRMKGGVEDRVLTEIRKKCAMALNAAKAVVNMQLRGEEVARDGKSLQQKKNAEHAAISIVAALWRKDSISTLASGTTEIDSQIEREKKAWGETIFGLLSQLLQDKDVVKQLGNRIDSVFDVQVIAERAGHPPIFTTPVNLERVLAATDLLKEAIDSKNATWRGRDAKTRAVRLENTHNNLIQYVREVLHGRIFAKGERMGMRLKYKGALYHMPPIDFWDPRWARLRHPRDKVYAILNPDLYMVENEKFGDAACIRRAALQALTFASVREYMQREHHKRGEPMRAETTQVARDQKSLLGISAAERRARMQLLVTHKMYTGRDASRLPHVIPYTFTALVPASDETYASFQDVPPHIASHREIPVGMRLVEVRAYTTPEEMTDWMHSFTDVERDRLYAFGRDRKEFPLTVEKYEADIKLRKDKTGQTSNLTFEEWKVFQSEQKELADAYEAMGTLMLEAVFEGMDIPVRVSMTRKNDDLAGGLDISITFLEADGKTPKKHADGSDMVLSVDVTYARYKHKLDQEVERGRVLPEAANELRGLDEGVDPEVVLQMGGKFLDDMESAPVQKMFRTLYETLSVMSVRTGNEDGTFTAPRPFSPRLIMSTEWHNTFFAMLDWVTRGGVDEGGWKDKSVAEKEQAWAFRNTEFKNAFAHTPLARRMEDALREQLAGLRDTAAWGPSIGADAAHAATSVSRLEEFEKVLPQRDTRRRVQFDKSLTMLARTLSPSHKGTQYERMRNALEAQFKHDTMYSHERADLRMRARYATYPEVESSPERVAEYAAACTALFREIAGTATIPEIRGINPTTRRADIGSFTIAAALVRSVVSRRDTFKAEAFDAQIATIRMKYTQLVAAAVDTHTLPAGDFMNGATT